MMHRETLFLRWGMLLISALISVGCTTDIGKTDGNSDETATVAVAPASAVFCKIGADRWRRVLEQDETGVLVASEDLSFEEVWDVDLSSKATSGNGREHRTWDELVVPLPREDIPCIGYALTYPGHQEEVSLEDILYFKKNATADPARDDILYRERLDYEAEIGVLIRKDRRDRFGYLMVNDLTDRGIQVRTFNPDDMAPGFSLAKSFEGALRVGPLLVVGNEASWDTMRIDLYLNGAMRQRLRADECLIRPGDFVDKHFDDGTGSSWILVATGTTDGVLFQSPDLWDKIILFFGAGFSMEEAEEDWLDHFRFLQPGDRIDLVSPALGRASASIVRGDAP